MQGEEGRRVLPALAMLEHGDWLLPQVGGEPYYRKPPLAQWLVAASFALTGERSDLTARLPSALSVLGFVLVVIGVPLPWMSLSSRFTAALIFMTSIGVVGKGRLIELEAMLMAWTGIASVVWLYLFSTPASKWLLWGALGVFCGIGMLLKGPVVLVVLYGLAFAVLLGTGRGRELGRVAPWLGFGLGGAIFLIWAVLAARAGSGREMLAGWSKELHQSTFPAGQWLNGADWLDKFIKAPANFLPWVLLVPLIWRSSLASSILPKWWPLYRSCRWALAVCYGLIFLVGNVARYTMLVIPLASLLLAWSLEEDADSCAARRWHRTLGLTAAALSLVSVAGLVLTGFTPGKSLLFAVSIACATWLWPRRKSHLAWPRVAALTGVLTGLVALFYTAYGVPYYRLRESRRPFAEALNRIIPSGERLFAYQAESLPMLFYLRVPFAFVNAPAAIGRDVHYLLVRTRDAAELKSELRGRGRLPYGLRHLEGRRVGSFELWQFEAKGDYEHAAAQTEHR